METRQVEESADVPDVSRLGEPVEGRLAPEVADADAGTLFWQKRASFERPVVAVCRGVFVRTFLDKQGIAVGDLGLRVRTSDAVLWSCA